MSKAKLLDQFYTNPLLAAQSVDQVLSVLPTLGYDMGKVAFLEPSAGTGAFLKALEARSPQSIRYATDLDPQHQEVVRADFLKEDIRKVAPGLPSSEHLVVIGNPPFGKKSDLAVSFIQRSLTYSDTVAFILPLQLRRYLTQRLLPSEASLILDEDCPKDSFIYQGKPYDVRCCLQVWTLRSSALPDLRQRVRPPTKHPDFTMWLYNCTPEAEKYFSKPWDFAVLRQGWGDFTPQVASDSPNLSRKNQWMFFHSENATVQDRLLSLDYEKLADKNTSVRGFGKADVIEEYVRLYGNEPFVDGLFSS